MRAYLQQYSPEQRKKIALYCTIGIAAILVTILIVMYTKPSTPRTNRSLSSIIVSGYTTVIEATPVLFKGK